MDLSNTRKRTHGKPVQSHKFSGGSAKTNRIWRPSGSELRKLRRQNGISLKQLAARVGISPSLLSNVETGKVAPLAEEKLRIIARELHVDPDRQQELGNGINAEHFQSAFGVALRRLRQQRRITLKGLARNVGVSAAYLCCIELGKFPPPSEDKVRLLASHLQYDSDELLAKAGKTASDLSDIINRHPRQYAAILRSMRKFREPDFGTLLESLVPQFDKVSATKADVRTGKLSGHLPLDWGLLKEQLGIKITVD